MRDGRTNLEEQYGNGVDRRAAIRKATAAAAVAWSAPLVMSTTASAQDGTCTPKCIPVGLPTIDPVLVAIDPQPSEQFIVRIRPDVSADGVTCGCGGTPTTAVLDFAGQPLADGVLVFGPFAVPNAGAQVATAVVTCIDRGGDTCASQCSRLVSFSFDSDEDGNPAVQFNATDPCT